MICCILRQQRAGTSKCLQKKTQETSENLFSFTSWYWYAHTDDPICTLLTDITIDVHTNTTGIEITKNKILIVYKDHNDNIQQQVCFF